MIKKFILLISSLLLLLIFISSCGGGKFPTLPKDSVLNTNTITNDSSSIPAFELTPAITNSNGGNNGGGNNGGDNGNGGNNGGDNNSGNNGNGGNNGGGNNKPTEVVQTVQVELPSGSITVKVTNGNFAAYNPTLEKAFYDQIKPSTMWIIDNYGGHRVYRFDDRVPNKPHLYYHRYHGMIQNVQDKEYVKAIILKMPYGGVGGGNGFEGKYVVGGLYKNLVQRDNSLPVGAYEIIVLTKRWYIGHGGSGYIINRYNAGFNVMYYYDPEFVYNKIYKELIPERPWVHHKRDDR